MKVSIPKITVICGNKKCRHMCDDPALEINFSLGEIHYYCPECGDDNKISMIPESKPLPKIRISR